ncbi:MAG: molecular chaperone TorD family protein [Eggerthellaceae bacterium]|nr:molecular chaperone TorD family protein [Eggerthellaceae bacterium]
MENNTDIIVDVPVEELALTEEAAVWAVRATAWELAAFTFRYPDAALAETVASGEWAEAAEELAAALGVELPETFAADARANVGEDAGKLLHALRAEATHLFIGAPDPACSPYEGVWRAGDDGVQALLFVNPHSMAVERFCKACGLGRPEGTNEPLDFAATEAELLQYLASLVAGIAEPVETSPAAEDLPGGSAQAAYEQFLAEHAQVWMPRFADKTAEESRIPFFRAAGAFLAAVVK